MANKNPHVVALRAIRKASNISGRAAGKGSRLLAGVERRTTRIIIEKAGDPSGNSSMSLDQFYYKQYPYLFPVHPALPLVGQKPSVTIFGFLDPKGFYGGIATLLLVGATLANKLGYDLRIAQTTGYSDKSNVLKFLADNGVIIEEERYSTIDLSKRNMQNYSYLPLHQDDVVLVSAWWDAQVASALPLRRKFVYLIQDFEPIFYNNSDEYVMADRTYYGEDFIPICNTNMLYTYFEQSGYDYIKRNAVYFEPAPAPAIPRRKPIQKTNAPKKLFLYGRPAVHRNLYSTALRALDIAFQDPRLRGQQWELYSAGSSNVSTIRLTSGHIIQNLGKMDINEYYSWAQTVDVAVSPMLAPHPNYPTLELASLGASVVSTKWRTKQSLDRYSKNILMAEPTPEDLAEKIIAAAITDIGERLKNLDMNDINSNWDSALDKPVNDVATLLRAEVLF